MTDSEFVARFGGIYEHSAWVAERAEAHVSDGASADELSRVMADCVDNASPERQLALIRAHPDLAGKAQIAGELTVDSTSEQASAGLDQCTAQEYRQFQVSNERYKKKFGFPFVMAVRDSNRLAILEGFEQRLDNSYEEEFETAIVEIHRIARMRLEALGL
jgi:OHCU decarboxylase